MIGRAGVQAFAGRGAGVRVPKEQATAIGASQQSLAIRAEQGEVNAALMVKWAPDGLAGEDVFQNGMAVAGGGGE